MSHEIIFPYRRNGQDIGFLDCRDRDFIFKPDKNSAAVIQLEVLKKNLRLMVKSKQARIIRAGEIEAVAVPRDLMMNLYL